MSVNGKLPCRHIKIFEDYIFQNLKLNYVLALTVLKNKKRFYIYNKL